MKEYRKAKMLLARMVAKSARILHLPAPPVMSYAINVDDGGKQDICSKSESWVRNALNCFETTSLFGDVKESGTVFGDGKISFKLVNGTVENLNGIGQIASIVGYSEAATYWVANQSNNGIVVGSGNAAESFDDYKLSTQIAHGTGAGQLSHGATTRVTRTWDEANRKWVIAIQRSFTNNSGNSIDVAEIGYQSAIYRPSVLAGPYLYVRDVLPEIISVPATKTLTVTYTAEFAY